MRTAICAALVLLPAVAAAKPNAGGTAAPACGAKILPLVVGNSWTYVAIPAPLPPSDQVKRISPTQPKQIVVTVKDVAAGKDETVVTLEEKITIDRTIDQKKPLLDEFTYTSTITCNAKKFDISPNSFFFAGEPGGVLGLEITQLDRAKGTSLQLTKGGIGDAQWREDLKMTWARKPTEGSGAKLGSGKLELERQFTPQEPETITTKQGQYRAEKLGLITTGRVMLDGAAPDAKPSELPANWISQLWLARDIGLVQSLNSYAHMYQLTESTLK
jgi:hypothetical protein